MFTKPNKSETVFQNRNQASGRPSPPSIIAVDMRISGDLESDGDVQIDGRIDGDLRIKSITVGEQATVNGAIHGDRIVISGSVNGEIRGKSVTLTSTAKVVGDIHHETLSIDAGAFLQGLCKRIEEVATDRGVVGSTPEKQAS